uniref:DEK-C domain-containing protein n=1 Tax=Timema tahoe TaxID=61484 RepID=A0A7R9IIZ6_9NEOP|nr:unnamed protein product [Timema tahoe]
MADISKDDLRKEVTADKVLFCGSLNLEQTHHPTPGLQFITERGHPYFTYDHFLAMLRIELGTTWLAYMIPTELWCRKNESEKTTEPAISDKDVAEPGPPHETQSVSSKKGASKHRLAAILKDADLSSMSAKKVRQQIEEKLDIDLTER